MGRKTGFITLGEFRVYCGMLLFALVSKQARKAVNFFIVNVYRSWDKSVIKQVFVIMNFVFLWQK